jgi:twitching motility protein PilT
MGRVVASEVLVPTPAIRNLIREGKTHQIYAAVQTSGAVGMQTMDSDLARLVGAGSITRAVAEQRASVPEELKRLLGSGGAYAAASADPALAAAADPAYAYQQQQQQAPPAPTPPVYTQGG